MGVTGRIRDTGEKILQSSFPAENSSNSQLLPHVVPHCIPLEVLVRNIVIVLCINLTI
jgi:hypothetical protein